MAVGQTSLVSNQSATDANSYTTASFSSTAGRPILVVVESSKETVSTTPTVTAHGLTWTQVATAETDGGTIRRRLTIFEAYPTSNGSGTMVIDFGGVTQYNCLWDIIEFTGADTTDMTVQSATLAGNGFGTVTVTLGAFSDAGNATFGTFGMNNTTSTLTAGGGFTEISNHADTTIDAPARLLTEFVASNDTSVDCDISGTTARRWVGIAVEIKAAVAAVDVEDPFGMRGFFGA